MGNNFNFNKTSTLTKTIRTQIIQKKRKREN